MSILRSLAACATIVFANAGNSHNESKHPNMPTEVVTMTITAETIAFSAKANSILAGRTVVTTITEDGQFTHIEPLPIIAK